MKFGGTTQLRDVRDGGGHGGAQQTHWLRFGPGSAAAVDTLTVRWVGGETETITGVTRRGQYRIVQDSGVAVKVP